jgi:hypothetical protein
MFLHNVGEMIYFKDEDFVVVNPNWFCNEVMGHLITLHGDVEKAGRKQIFQDGFGEMEDIQRLLKLSLKKITHKCVGDTINIPKYLVHLMKKMDLAYEEKPKGDRDAQISTRIFVPTTLKFHDVIAKDEKCLQWTFDFPHDANLIHLG